MSDAFSPKYGQALVRAKKTFLEAKFFPYDSDRLRRGSAPPRANADEEACNSDTLSSSEDLVFWSSEDCQNPPDIDEIATQEDTFQEQVVLQTSEIRHGNASVVQGITPGEDSPCACIETRKSVIDMVCPMTPKLGKAFVKTKKTFLEFKFKAYDDSPVRRTSAPALLGCRGTDEDMWDTKASTIDSDVQVLWTSEDLVPQPDANGYPKALADNLSEEPWNANSSALMSTLETKHKSPSKAHRDRTRHCKGKRLRYKKLMMHLCERIDKDPLGFDLALIHWPPSLVDNMDSKKYLLHVLEDHRTKALRRTCLKR